MKRWAVMFFFVAGCSLSAAVGFWFGFREAWLLGIAADLLPRGSIATQQLNALRAGKTNNVVVGLEYYVDNGLIRGHELFEHPMRSFWAPLWGLEVYPEYEKYATRLADYRKEHPSLLKPGENTATIKMMVERYATKP
jgi:hypothetical protein